MSRLRNPFLLVLAAFVACSEPSPIPSGSDVGTDPPTISPSPVQVIVGETVALRLEGIPLRLFVVWTSDNPEIASVTAGGLVRGILTGRTNVTARAASFSASVEVMVLDPQ